MTPKQFKEARAQLGLSISQMADLIGVTPTQVRRMAMPREAAAHRPVQPVTQRLLSAYLEGYRPKDWPAE